MHFKLLTTALYCRLVCIDDKHLLKVRELGLPVAGAERRETVLVHVGTLELGN